MLNPRNSYDQYSSPTSLGISEKWERVLCYVLGWISGLFFLFAEQRNPTVRAHARQSILVFGVLNIIAWVLGWISGAGILVISGIFGLVGVAVGIIIFIAWAGLMIAAYMSPVTFFGNRGRWV